MRSLFLSIIFLSLVSVMPACGDSDSTGTFADSNLIAIDSTNNRLFVTQPRGELFLFSADTLTNVGDQPIVSEDTLASTNALLPQIITHIQALAVGATTRLFIHGVFTDAVGDLVTNRIRVLDFDGTSFTEAAFSPIILSDGDAATTDSDNSYADLLVDSQNGLIFVTDASQGWLHVLDVTDGSVVAGPIAIAGNPQGLSLSDDHLYVCNSSTTAIQQLITVVNVTDFSTTAIDLDIPCHQISVASNASGTVLVAKHSASQQVLLTEVDTTTYATATAIVSATSGIANGTLTSGAGISSSVEKLLTAINSDLIYGYATEQDGTVRSIAFAQDLSSFTLTDLPTTATDLTEATLYQSGGNDQIAYFVSQNGFVLSLTVGSTDIDIKN